MAFFFPAYVTGQLEEWLQVLTTTPKKKKIDLMRTRTSPPPQVQFDPSLQNEFRVHSKRAESAPIKKHKTQSCHVASPRKNEVTNSSAARVKAQSQAVMN